MRRWANRYPLAAGMLAGLLLAQTYTVVFAVRMIRSLLAGGGSSGDLVLIAYAVLIGGVLGALLGLVCALAGALTRTAVRALRPSTGDRGGAVAVAAGAGVASAAVTAVTGGTGPLMIGVLTLPVPVFVAAALVAGGVAFAVAAPPAERPGRVTREYDAPRHVD